MKKIRDWNFSARRLKDTPKKLSGWRWFLSFLSWGTGKTIGKILPLLTFGPLFNYFAKKRAAKRFDIMQKKRKHEQIPGWDGAKFDPDADTGNDIMADFRRVPTVWSTMIAEKAVDDTGHPLDPEISIMIDQPKSGSTQTMNGKAVGHAMLGIEYSRFSKITNRYERYFLQYGFYPAADFSERPSTIMTGMHKDAFVPGEMRNDLGHTYDISRTYPAKQRQVSEIFKASEKYADKGYGIYGRNCTTFVKEMLVDHAHLAIPQDIFRMTEVRHSSIGNLGLFGASALTSNAMAGSRNIFMDYRKEDDLTYQGYGNKLTTQEDFTRFQESAEKGGGFSKMTISPAQTGENMRRLSGENEGRIGSHNYDRPLIGANGQRNLSPARLRHAVMTTGNNLHQLITRICPPEMQNRLPAEAFNTLALLSGMANPLAGFEQKVEAYAKEKNIDKSEVLVHKAISGDQLREARQEISANVKLVSKMLTKYFKNDARLHQPVLDFISLLQICGWYLDDLYRNHEARNRLGGRPREHPG